MRKPAFYICENKGADQLQGNRAADQRLPFHFIDSTTPYILNPNSHLLGLYSPVCVRPDWKNQRVSHETIHIFDNYISSIGYSHLNFCHFKFKKIDFILQIFSIIKTISIYFDLQWLPMPVTMVMIPSEILSQTAAFTDKIVNLLTISRNY